MSNYIRRSSIKGCRYPQPVSVHQELIPGRKPAEFVTLGGRHYRRDNIRNKVHLVGYDLEGKPITIPYQTCTLVKVREVLSE